MSCLNRNDILNTPTTIDISQIECGDTKLQTYVSMLALYITQTDGAAALTYKLRYVRELTQG